MKQFIRKQGIVALWVYTGNILVGYAMGWTAPVVEKLRSPDQSTLPEPATDDQIAWIGSSVFFAIFICPFISGYLGNVVGRKPCLFVGAILMMSSFIMVIFTGSIEIIYALRIIKGIGINVILSLHFVYLGEIASTEIRGIILTATAIFGSIGSLIAYSVGPYVSYAATGYVGVALSAAYLVGLFCIPESPIYHIIKDNDTEAQTILNNLGRGDETELIKITKISITESRQSSHRWVQLFKQRSNRKALFIVVSLGIFQQLSGVGAIIFYSTTIFEVAGSSIRSDIATIILGLTQLLACIIAPLFVERSGRRVLLLISCAGCFVSLGLLATYFYLDHIDHVVVESIGWLPLVTLIAFVLSYSGLGTIPFTLIGEMFSINVRSIGSAFTITIGSFFGFITVTVFAYVIALSGHFVFGIFAASCVVAFVFIAIFVPETKGKSLAEIEVMLGR